MIEIKKKSEGRENALLVGVIRPEQSDEQTKEYIDELAFLADTAGADTKIKILQKLQMPHPKTYVGKGKVEEIKQKIEEHNIDLVIFDDELTPSQVKNLENQLEIKVLDRTNLILDIFAARARTSHARTQVELAQYQYLLPRLTRMWTHLERQKGGIGMRGPGETQIETDRRIIQQKISLLKEKLKKIDQQMLQQRKNRVDLIRVALVGYTNVGKSTLMNTVAKADVFAENKLFATLDTTVRKVQIDLTPFLLSDTVGFIRKLPTQLVESFKSTLDELKEADILLHVVDISHPNFEEQIANVNQTIRDITKDEEKRVIMVFNKIDAFRYTPKDEDDLSPMTRENYPLEHWKKTWMGKLENCCLFISATEKSNMDAFRALLLEEVRNMYSIRYPYFKFDSPQIDVE